MKNIKKFIPVALLSAAFVVACNPGGGKPAEKTITNITACLSNPSRVLHFGDKVNKSDFKVEVTYSDSTKSTLKDSEYKIYDDSYTEITKFPYAIEYGGPFDTTRNFTFVTNDGGHGCTIDKNNRHIDKIYEFEYGNRGTNIFDTYINGTVSTTITVEGNVLNDKSGKKVSNAKYKSNHSKIEVDDTNGDFTYTGLPSDFPTAVISAYVDDVCVNKYTLSRFKKDVENISVKLGYQIIYTGDETSKSTYKPNEGKLVFPSIIDNDIITQIGPDAISTGKSNFSNCVAITSIEFPDTLTNINKECFKGCTGLEGDIRIPEGVNNIGTDAFYNCGNAKFVFEYTEGWVYHYNDIDYNVDPDYMKDSEITTWMLQQEGASLVNKNLH